MRRPIAILAGLLAALLPLLSGQAETHERAFHTRLLGLGSVPLDELDRAMRSWATRSAAQSAR